MIATTTTITMSSKGQFTLPADIRKGLNLTTGDQLAVDFNVPMRTIFLKKPLTIEQVNQMNQKALKRNNTSLRGYKSGDGFRAHVAKKYGV
jgi:AbrB family looped-hinge helix DNA binding protein